VTVHFYTRQGCHLCEAAEAILADAQAELGFAVKRIDIDADAASRELYNEEVPVTLLPNGHRFRYGLDAIEFRKQLKRAAAHLRI
jgi:glutaredoxin